MEFVEFFTQMHWAVIMLLIITIVFLIIEGVIPGFGFFGITGILSGIATIICEAIFTKSLFDVFLMIFLILVVFTLLFIAFSHSFTKGVLKKTPLVENSSALPENYNGDDELKLLVGKTGKVVSICKPVGKAKIDDKVYTVHSVKGTIYEDDNIIVMEIKNNSIWVEYVGGKND